jgi:hypothetical protein
MGVAVSAQAAVFDFSYTFGGGQVVSGVAEGTVQADGNTINLFPVDSFTADGQSIDPAFVSSQGTGIRPLSSLSTDRSWILRSSIPRIYPALS